MLKNLNSEQKNILASIRQGMDFAADIAHACITVYLASDDKRFFARLPSVHAQNAVFAAAGTGARA